MFSFFSALFAKIAAVFLALFASIAPFNVSGTHLTAPQYPASYSTSSSSESTTTLSATQSPATTSPPQTSSSSSPTHPPQNDTTTSTASTSASSSPEVVPYPPGTDLSAIKAATVNIICISIDDKVPSMTASGVIIDPRGVILTDAHVAQFFLLTDHIKDGTLRCVIRGGNPAQTEYQAELLYIPKEWVEHNDELLDDSSAKGTGEDDFALLRITNTVKGEDTDAIPYLPYSASAKLSKGDTVVLSAYPAEFIPTSDIDTSLYDLSLATKISDVFTFGKNTVDIVSLPGAYLAQRGSSGGPMVDSDGNVTGLITTESEEPIANNERDLFALTIPYINRELEKFTGESLDEMLSGNLSRKAIDFSLYDAPALRKIIEQELPQN